MRSVLIVPTYNEAANIARFLTQVRTDAPDTEILVVDDNSPDQTAKIAETLAAKLGSIKVLNRNGQRGYAVASREAMLAAIESGYDVIATMDADFSHNPADIPRFLQAAQEQNADLVLGSRYSGGIRVINWPLPRLLLSLWGGFYTRIITGMPFSDPTGGFKCFRRETLAAIDVGSVTANGYSFQIELTHRVWRKGLKVAEVPIIFTDREQGVSKMSRDIAIEAAWMVWRLLLENRLRRHLDTTKE
jgi:dolichol-phosphate mannosyltransferase